jgi:uncharacterized membrane protein
MLATAIPRAWAAGMSTPSSPTPNCWISRGRSRSIIAASIRVIIGTITSTGPSAEDGPTSTSSSGSSSRSSSGPAGNAVEATRIRTAPIMSPAAARIVDLAYGSMSGPQIGLALSVFLACTVEAVEALTIILAVGVTRSWRSTMTGVAVAVAALAVITGALGPALTALPISALRVVVGGLLLVFGLQWLRKAILRASGLKALHDEEALYGEGIDAARQAGAVREGIDPYAFTIAFKGVLLEGLEVVFIVLTFGANQHDIGLAAIAAAAAIVLVTAAGIAVHAPLARVPENRMKFCVGVMLTSFGIFWGGEGAGAHWPGGDAALLAIVPVTLALALGLVASGRRRTAAVAEAVRA